MIVCLPRLGNLRKALNTFYLRLKYGVGLYGKEPLSEKEGNVLFNDALNTFYLRLYGVGNMVKNHSARGNPFQPLDELLFPIRQIE